MRSFERAQNAVVGLLSAAAFMLFAGLFVALAGVLGVRAVQAASDAVALEVLRRALTESGLLIALSLPAAVLLGIFLALYWSEYQDERLARIGQNIGRELARLPDLFIAVALVALVSPEQRSSRALLCFAVFVPTLVYVATATSGLLAELQPVYRDVALSLGIRRHRWIFAAVRRIALRPICGIVLTALGRVLTAVAPLLVLSPLRAEAPLPLELVRDRDAHAVALLALVLLLIVVLTKGAGRALLGSDSRPLHERT